MLSLKCKCKVTALFMVSFVSLVFATENVVEVSDNVKKLGSNAFRNRKDIVLVTVPYSVNSIDKDAFYNCPNLVSITFDDDCNWYITQDKENWERKTMGMKVDVTDSTTNASMLRLRRYYFYKVEQ